MNQDLTEACERANEALSNNDLNGALRLLEPWIAGTDISVTDEQWSATYELFSRITELKFGEDLGIVASALASEPSNPDRGYELGYTLIEHGRADLAIGVLSRAHHQVSGNARIVAELITALEIKGRHEEIAVVLARESELVDSTHHFAYLKAFNSIVLGELNEARQILPRLLNTTDETQIYMTKRIQGMLMRADVIEASQPLERSNLRGWHYVMTGGILLHIAPDNMAGRLRGGYGKTWDTDNRVLLGLSSLVAVCEVLDLTFPAILIPPDRNSQILGHALGALFQLPVEEWFGDSEAGIVTVYDVGELIPELRQPLKEHHPNQSLFVQSCSSLREHIVAPDLLTYFYEFNTSPWSSGISIENQYIEAVKGDPEDVAERVLDSELSAEQLAEIDELKRFVSLLVDTDIPSDYKLAALRHTGQRERIWLYSPIP